MLLSETGARYDEDLAKPPRFAPLTQHCRNGVATLFACVHGTTPRRAAPAVAVFVSLAAVDLTDVGSVWRSSFAAAGILRLVEPMNLLFRSGDISKN